MSKATDKDRYPTLTSSGRDILKRMREHPSAPIFRNKSGSRLRDEDLAALHEHEASVADAKITLAKPRWLSPFITNQYEDVPHYRALGSATKRIEDVPPISRSDLSADIAAFVPDSVDVSRMMHFQTSGTTGHPLLVPSHPQVAGRYLSYHKRALARFGITPQNGEGQMGVVLLGYQQKCFTYVSVTPQMGESGLAKINLHPVDWQEPHHREEWLDAMAPEIIAGDPISFAALLDLPMQHKPRALLSVAMMLSDGMRQALEERFGCPVLDIYSMNEAGPIGVYDSALGGHVLLQDQLYIEILDESGAPVQEGERGEITLTGGFNFCLPLLRYRTGDYGALSDTKGAPLIEGLEGRRPVRFRTSGKEWLNNVDITHALTSLAVAQIGLHQNKDDSLILYLRPGDIARGGEAEAILKNLFGSVPIQTKAIKAEDKFLQYTSDLEP